ncbi:MAG TPA: GNAT family N-acetyltransferase [Ktedonobacterales bacterium]|nr:GNAT family N-acetyltransferase [Ktedonobacterales bacterium]
MRLETPRLVIRTFEPRDGDSWIALANAPETRRFTPAAPPATPDVFQGALERRHAMERDHGHAMWAVDEKETGAFVGQCGLYPAEQKGPEPELAYHFNLSSWGKGYATEAATAVLAYAFGPAGLDPVLAFVIPANIASCRVVEKAGMRLVGSGTFYDIPDVRKYVAERAWWRPPQPG